MLFLVDYENVGNTGLRGYHYLDTTDQIVVFYSEAKKHMERRTLDDITGSGCVFEICKLIKSGKNALDFYIVCRLEEVHALLEGKKKTSRAIYLGCIHSFGRTNGLVIYNRVKECKEL